MSMCRTTTSVPALCTANRPSSSTELKSPVSPFSGRKEFLNLGSSSPLGERDGVVAFDSTAWEIYLDSGAFMIINVMS